VDIGISFCDLDTTGQYVHQLPRGHCRLVADLHDWSVGGFPFHENRG